MPLADDAAPRALIGSKEALGKAGHPSEGCGSPLRFSRWPTDPRPDAP